MEGMQVDAGTVDWEFCQEEPSNTADGMTAPSGEAHSGQAVNDIIQPALPMAAAIPSGRPSAAESFPPGFTRAPWDKGNWHFHAACCSEHGIHVIYSYIRLHNVASKCAACRPEWQALLQRNDESKATYIKRMRLLGLHFNRPSSAPQPEQAPQADVPQEMALEVLQAETAAQATVDEEEQKMLRPEAPERDEQLVEEDHERLREDSASLRQDLQREREDNARVRRDNERLMGDFRRERGDNDRVRAQNERLRQESERLRKAARLQKEQCQGEVARLQAQLGALQDSMRGELERHRQHMLDLIEHPPVTRPHLAALPAPVQDGRAQLKRKPAPEEPRSNGVAAGHSAREILPRAGSRGDKALRIQPGGAALQRSANAGPQQRALQQQEVVLANGMGATGGPVTPGIAAGERKQKQRRQQPVGKVLSAKNGRTSAGDAARERRKQKELPACGAAGAETGEAAAGDAAQPTRLLLQQAEQLAAGACRELLQQAAQLVEERSEDRHGTREPSRAAKERVQLQQRQAQLVIVSTSTSSAAAGPSRASQEACLHAKAGAIATGKAADDRSKPSARIAGEAGRVITGAADARHAEELQKHHVAPPGKGSGTARSGAHQGAKRQRKMEAHQRRAPGAAESEQAAAAGLPEEAGRQQLLSALLHVRQAAAGNACVDGHRVLHFPLWAYFEEARLDQVNSVWEADP